MDVLCVSYRNLCVISLRWVLLHKKSPNHIYFNVTIQRSCVRNEFVLLCSLESVCCTSKWSWTDYFFSADVNEQMCSTNPRGNPQSIQYFIWWCPGISYLFRGDGSKREVVDEIHIHSFLFLFEIVGRRDHSECLREQRRRDVTENDKLVVSCEERSILPCESDCLVQCPASRSSRLLVLDFPSIDVEGISSQW